MGAGFAQMPNLPVLPVPSAPVSLTAGMVTPEDVAVQKEEYKKGIDDQQKQGEAILNEQTLQQREYIRNQAEQQKALAMGRWDQHLRAQEIIAEQEYQAQLAKLHETVRQQKVALAKQAAQMVMEYNSRKVQQEINTRHYEIQLQHWHANSATMDLPFEDRLRFQAQVAAQQRQAMRRVGDNLPEIPVNMWIGGDQGLAGEALTDESPYPLALGA